jgi:uncharacterized caspase-like protein
MRKLRSDEQTRAEVIGLLTRLCSWTPAVALFLLVYAGNAAAQNRNLILKEAEGQGTVRLALLIGNSNYNRNDTLPQLKNPSNDARDIAAALKENGFSKIEVVLDADHRTMRNAISQFGEDLRKAGRDAVGLFYYAGHGVEEGGRNYLIPLGTRISSPKDLEFDAVDAQRVLAYMEEAGNAVNIIVLDACRDNPFPQLNKFRSSASSAGLAQMRAPTGSFIAFAAAPGQKASDGEGRNGLFTQHLLASLRAPNSNIDAVFTRVTAAVTEKTGRAQVPWKQSSLTNDFFFRREALQGVDPAEFARLEEEKKKLESQRVLMEQERQRELAKLEEQRRADQARIEAERRANDARLEDERRRNQALIEQQQQQQRQQSNRRAPNLIITP